MAALREVAARFGIQVDNRQLNGLNQSIGGAIGNLRTLGAALIGGAAVRGIQNFVRESINMGDELDKSSQQVGMSVAELQSWRFAADRAGVDARAMTQSLMRLQRAAFEGARGSAMYADAFNRLGIDVRDADGNLRSADSLMREMARAMSGLENETEKVALAQQLMGRSGARLLPLLNGGEEAVAELHARFAELGGGLSQDFVTNAAEAQDALTDWGVAMDSIRSRLVVSFMPALTRVIVGASNLFGRFSRLLEGTHAIELALAALAGVAAYFAVQFLIAFGGPILIGLAVAAAIAFIILLVDDLITLFSGGRSVIGGFIDEMFGVGTAAQLVQDLKDAWDGLTLAVRRATYAVGTFFGLDMEEVDDGIANEEIGADEARRRVDEAAARQGRITGRRGESFEEALARTNRTRERLGLPALGPNGEAPAEGRGAARPRTAARPRGGRGGAAVVDARANIPITVEGADNPAETARRVRTELERVLATRDRDMAVALGQDTDAEE